MVDRLPGCWSCPAWKRAGLRQVDIFVGRCSSGDRAGWTTEASYICPTHPNYRERNATGIYGRSLLPERTYDHMFETYRGPAGECRVRMKRDGSIRNDHHDWWETVAAPEGWTG